MNFCCVGAGIDGLGDMRHICGIIAVDERDKPEKEGKVNCALLYTPQPTTYSIP